MKTIKCTEGNELQSNLFNWDYLIRHEGIYHNADDESNIYLISIENQFGNKLNSVMWYNSKSGDLATPDPKYVSKSFIQVPGNLLVKLVSKTS